MNHKFKPGDWVIRTGGDWGDVKTGQAYVVLSYDFGHEDTLFKIANSDKGYDQENFEIHPANGSPLLEALK